VNARLLTFGLALGTILSMPAIAQTPAGCAKAAQAEAGHPQLAQAEGSRTNVAQAEAERPQLAQAEGSRTNLAQAESHGAAQQVTGTADPCR